MRSSILAVVASLVGCASTLPSNNASRPIKVAISAEGDRAEEVRFRLERRLVRDPDVGIADGGTHARVELNLGLGAIDVCTSGVCFGMRAEFLPSADDTDRLDELVRWATHEILERLHGRWPQIATR